MSNLATSEPAIAAARAVATGEDARLRRLRFFIAFLRARPSFAVGYAIVAIVIVVALFAPWLAPYGPMTADPTVYLLPPGGSQCSVPTEPAWISSAAWCSRRALILR